MNCTRWKSSPNELGERLGQRGLPQSREVLDQQVALGEQAPDGELHRLVVGVQDALHRLDDPGIEGAERSTSRPSGVRPRRRFADRLVERAHAAPERRPAIVRTGRG